MDTMTEERARVTGGVDTHRDFHVAAALDARGAELGCEQFPTDPAGYAALLGWLAGFGAVEAVGVEGTGTYGRGLARHLQANGVAVIEVDRPNRQNRRRRGKNDTIDAISAARAVQGGSATAIAKTGNGPIEQLRVLRLVRRSVRKERIRVLSQLRAVAVTAPDDIRSDLAGRTPIGVAQHAAKYRVADPTTPTGTVKYALRSLARRAEDLRAEAKALDKIIAGIVTDIAPELIAQPGVGPDSASALLVAAGDNPHRIHSEAAFAKLCAAAPLDASSGMQRRHRLSRSGNRDANAALFRIIIVRLKDHPETQAYIARRTAEGKTKLEAIRCLKRYLARQLYPHVLAANST